MAQHDRHAAPLDTLGVTEQREDVSRSDGRTIAREGDMTTTLAQKACTPCRGGVPPLDPAAATRYLGETPGWSLLDDSRRIERRFRFSNFRQALDFVQQVGILAEAEGHHPDVAFGWGYATISLQTKKIKGLHENDFIMAVKINAIAEDRGTNHAR